MVKVLDAKVPLLYPYYRHCIHHMEKRQKTIQKQFPGHAYVMDWVSPLSRIRLSWHEIPVAYCIHKISSLPPVTKVQDSPPPFSSLEGRFLFIVGKFGFVFRDLFVVKVACIATLQISDLTREDELATSWNMEDCPRYFDNIGINCRGGGEFDLVERLTSWAKCFINLKNIFNLSGLK